MAVTATTAIGITIRGTQDFESFDDDLSTDMGDTFANWYFGVCSKRSFRDNLGWDRRIDVPIPAVHVTVKNSTAMINIQVVKVLLLLGIVMSYNVIVIPTVKECQTLSSLSINSNATPYCTTKFGMSIRRVGLTR